MSEVDLEMFRDSANNNISLLKGVILSFVATLMDDIVLKVWKSTVKFFPNQKPWVGRSIHAALKEHIAPYNAGLLSGDMKEYKAACYKLRRDIVDTKRRYRDKMEAPFQKKDTQSIWQGLREITEYKGRHPSMVSADASRANDLNSFYARFKASNANSYQ